MFIAVAIAGASLIGGLIQSDAVGDAADAQGAAADAGIAEQRRRFDEVQKLLAPYVNAGTGALGGQQNLLGLNGTDAQSQAIAGIQGSPQFAALTKQGEDAILANASATGGLRGGNTQAALAQFRPALLAQLIDQQYSRLGGLASLGQNAAAGTGNAGIATGNQITALLQQQGAAQAGGALGQANAWGSAINGGLGMFAGLGGFRGLGTPTSDPGQTGIVGGNGLQIPPGFKF